MKRLDDKQISGKPVFPPAGNRHSRGRTGRNTQKQPTLPHHDTKHPPRR
ncbi:MAG: hypothetical protein LBD91_04635 [Prevotellaceae bacterium]|nr:hypothetical protein [Prevotellaceae bacterium]